MTRDGGRRPGQRYKSLLVWQILLRETDEKHPLTSYEIAEKLWGLGVEAEEHSIGRDIKELQRLYAADEEEAIEQGERLGYEIRYDGSGKRGYKVIKRPCRFSDLQLLAECIRSARFISREQEKRLLKALTEYCSTYQQAELEREAYLIDREKTENEKIIAYIQQINRAIRNSHKIRFQYLKYTLQNRKEQTPRRKGSLYVLSPFKILINEGNFYLLGYDGKRIVRYRIDRMRDVRELQEPRDGVEAYEAIDVRTYTKRVFSMFGGEEKKVQIRFANDLLDTVIDRFGADDAFYTPTDERHFTLSANVEVSDQFYAWVCRFRKRAMIVGPPEVVEGFKRFLGDIQGRYEG